MTALVDVAGSLLIAVGLGGLVRFLRWDAKARAEIRDLERRIQEARRG